MSSKSSNTPKPSKLSTSVLSGVNFISTGRILIGAGMILAPQPVLGLFGLSLPDNLIYLARLTGIRDLVLGGLLWTARTDDSTALGRSELRRALTAGVIADTADSVATLCAFATGNYDLRYTVVFFALVTPFIGLGTLGLSSL
ncbi:hypothetical protein F5Y18DRAFT_389064 [Xylariaceae sp. FL1019]|nr:hypothetical protein F5Y18DRAFT_389064 [Xylariaceae sp. FL1019]